MTQLYVLDADHKPVPVEDVREWAKWYELLGVRLVEQTTFEGILVSTVFLGIDHSFGVGPPVLFETMVFGGKHADYQARCRTWDEAVEQHKRVVEMVKEDL